MSIRSLLATSCFCALLIASPIAYSADEAAATGDEPSNVQLKGGVIKVDVQLNNLTDARLDISRVRKAIANLYDEVTRQQVTMTYSPNMVGTMVIMTPTPTFSGQFLQARSKCADASMSEIVPIIKLFKEEVDVAIEDNRRVDASAATIKQIEPLRDQAFKSVHSSFETLTQLEKLTSTSAYNNQAIATASKSLDKNMKDLDKNLKRAISILQKEAKSTKSTKSAKS